MIWKVCRFKLIMACLLVGFGVWPGILPAKTVETAAAVVSLDYCADQYVLKLLSADRIKALSPDAVREFSYMRQAALDHPSVKPTAEEVIARKPDLIVRTYGGGPNASHFFKRLGIP
ncbi:MAG: ABC transporter substrate-binding protein, partial [Gammaproteobacteria bacterium]|nr:ABC transporter substrate-binding protein [Gammaproteobacteria bacterium]